MFIEVTDYNNRTLVINTDMIIFFREFNHESIVIKLKHEPDLLRIKMSITEFCTFINKLSQDEI